MKKISGFSLIELLVVITIIGIITAISIPTFSSWQNKNEYRQTIERLLGMINTARINTQSEKECLFENKTTGNWMIELTFDSAVLGCFEGTTFEEKSNTKYIFERDTIKNKVLFFENIESFNKGLETPIEVDDNTPVRIMWSKDDNKLETVSIYSKIISNSGLVVIPANDVSMNYVYAPEPAFTKPICLSRVAGYPYISKNLYDYSNPDTLCTE